MLNGICHRIIFEEGKDCTPWQEYVRRGSPAGEETKAAEILSIIQNDIVEQCNSEWANNVVMVKKADGSPRCCIDFRRLNQITKPDPYPLARIDDALDTLGSVKVYSTIDCAAAFGYVQWQRKTRIRQRSSPDSLDS